MSAVEATVEEEDDDGPWLLVFPLLLRWVNSVRPSSPVSG